jgi:hypothetical protein
MVRIKLETFRGVLPRVNPGSIFGWGLIFIFEAL